MKLTVRIEMDNAAFADGKPTFIYRAFGEMEGEEFVTELFTRAKDRLDAKDAILAILPNATFYR